ncbi:LPS export ABC transporter periplasmic protein LptC [Nitrosomonas sp. Nm58]|uniref:LPS export ABC transporter periplasmic protein LptC n=1 Tax=Nitrosomonas sp. Nm58 TaxID=200126 RepID=UPI00089C7319|nr:LPS export ABC transporter periplasmic protein LptC [Nitrosomonas sp. Nm58]SDY02181.1 lipopolysaccharide export system protein LptC [Nitrosomonas sp. Nm58]
MIHRLPPGPAVLLIILILLTFLLNQTIQQPRIREDNGLNNNPDYIIENLSGVEVVHDKAIQHIFSADVMTHFPEGDITYLEPVDFLIIQPDKPVTRINADRAELTAGKNDIYLKGDVVVSREKEADKITMSTQFLHLIPDADIAKTDQPVTIARMNTIVNAVGMELNNRTGRIELKSRVKARDDKKPGSADRPSNKK